MAKRLITWATQVLESVDVPRDDAVTTAQYLVRSDLRGYSTHGLARLTSYIDLLTDGKVATSPNIRINRDGSVWKVEADGALGQVVAGRVLEEALPYMANEAMLWVSVREPSHLGALGIFALEAAEAGIICLLGQRTPPLLGLPGFSQSTIGHNPFAFGCPAGPGSTPLVIDMACSVAARGHILLAARDQKPIPSGWALDSNGVSTIDPAAALIGMLEPMGGYKGMALAMMFECLSGGLPATQTTNENITMDVPLHGAVPRQNAFFLFLNPAIVGDLNAFTAYMDHWIDRYKAASGDKAHLPGERGSKQEENALNAGVSYSNIIETELQQLANRFDLPLPIEW